MTPPGLYYEVTPAGGPVNGVVFPPGSKSITNRALVLASLARGESVLRGCLISDDTILMMAGLKNVGFQVRRSGRDDSILVRGGAGRIPWDDGRIWAGNAGSVSRFLLVLLPQGAGSYRLDGDARMRTRPMGHLIAILRDMGAEIRSETLEGHLPVTVAGHGGLRGGPVVMNAGDSSKFVSALLMIGPRMANGLDLTVDCDLASRPYVDITLDLMSEFGASTMRRGYSRFEIPRGRYTGREFTVEADASAAAFFLSAAAFSRGRVKVCGLGPGSRQPDARFPEILEAMGAKVSHGPDWIQVQGDRLTGGTFDLSCMPDSAMALAVTALFASGPTEIVNTTSLRSKESDRIATLAEGIRAMGAVAKERNDGLRIEPAQLRGATIRTRDDPRIAMAFAMAGLMVPGVIIENPAVVSKSYPDFFQRLEELTGRPGRKFKVQDGKG